VSVSLSAFPPQTGHLHFTNSSTFFSGDSPFPVISMFSGSLTGRWSSGIGTIPHFSQYITGIGVPQYLCLEMHQSLNL